MNPDFHLERVVSPEAISILIDESYLLMSDQFVGPTLSSQSVWLQGEVAAHSGTVPGNTFIQSYEEKKNNKKNKLTPI